MLTMRTCKDAPLRDLVRGIMEHFRTKYGLVMVDPHFWYKGRHMLLNEMLYSTPSKSLLLITEGPTLPEELMEHKGALRQCSKENCKRSWHF